MTMNNPAVRLGNKCVTQVCLVIILLSSERSAANTSAHERYKFRVTTTTHARARQLVKVETKPATAVTKQQLTRTTSSFMSAVMILLLFGFKHVTCRATSSISRSDVHNAKVHNARIDAAAHTAKRS